MKRALLAMTLATAAAPTGAQAVDLDAQSVRHQCRPTHGPRFCAAVEQRIAIVRLRPFNLREEARTHKPHRSFVPGWHVKTLKLQNLRLRHRIRWLASLPSWHPTSAVGAICFFWHPCGFALAVARCESGLSTRAVNGQYLGLFQMGDYARSRYGHGSDAFTQARAAHDYWLDSGWGPWTCARMV